MQIGGAGIPEGAGGVRPVAAARGGDHCVRVYYNREYFGSTWDECSTSGARSRPRRSTGSGSGLGLGQGPQRIASRHSGGGVGPINNRGPFHVESFQSLKGIVVVANPRVGAKAGAGEEAEVDTDSSVPIEHLPYTGTGSHTSRVAPEPQTEQKSGSGRSAGPQAAKAANSSNKTSPAKSYTHKEEV